MNASATHDGHKKGQQKNIATLFTGWQYLQETNASVTD